MDQQFVFLSFFFLFCFRFTDFIVVCMPECVSVYHMCAQCLWGVRNGGSDPLELEIQIAVSFCVGVGTELRSSAGAAALIC